MTKMMNLSPETVSLLLLLALLSPTLLLCSGDSTTVEDESPPTVCIIGSGIGGSSVAHFLRNYSASTALSRSRILMFERHERVGGRMRTVTVSGDTFEAGGSILHPKNYHARDFVERFNLTVRSPTAVEECSAVGIWDGKRFVFKTFGSSIPFVDKIVSWLNDVYMFVRYGFSLLRMSNFIENMIDNFLKYYESLESRPVFDSVEGMLKWSGLYNLTKVTLQEKLSEAQLSPLLVNELVTVITRINYGQSVLISGLAGAVSLAGSGGGLWSVEGGNWQMAAKLINHSDVTLHLNEQIQSVSHLGDYYELKSAKGNSFKCDVTVVSTPLDEVDIQFSPAISIPKRELQHTHATFVRGLLNPGYFGMKLVSDVPALVGTLEDPLIPFSCISILRKYSATDMTYKMFTRQPASDSLLDELFSARTETVRIDWGAYPKYHAPEVFAPFILDDHHLYYVNAFENAASTMETSAVAGENMARLIVSRFRTKESSSSSPSSDTRSCSSGLHSDM
ncbi:PREDICTED: farnesylcysteine lyase [Brassica oleracea var. oleracea]|uniref:Prenylcysteine lyase domain-containing protein n=1 Tax=Brassica oleracea var. oleracea TaxID=109376 RepID=A0A0D3BFA5_BRAOL|nr:PREDICTED: farnesylcysteine lyase [Brassica oleracea var. oleracea]